MGLARALRPIHQASVTGISVTHWTLVAHASEVQLERSDGFRAVARRMLQSPEWQQVVGQPVDPGQTLLIQAAPGSGKSTLLREWCRGRPNNKILLLAFNKAVAKQLPGVSQSSFFIFPLVNAPLGEPIGEQ